MSAQYDIVRTVEKGKSGALIEFAVSEDDLVTVRTLTGYAAWVTFWYAGSAPHVSGRAAKIDGVNGLALYLTQGDEFPTAGTCFMQLTIMAPESGIGTGRGYFEASLPAVRRDVIEVPT